MNLEGKHLPRMEDIYLLKALQPGINDFTRSSRHSPIPVQLPLPLASIKLQSLQASLPPLKNLSVPPKSRIQNPWSWDFCLPSFQRFNASTISRPQCASNQFSPTP